MLERKAAYSETRQENLMVFACCESNSGGYGNNTDSQPWERAQRSLKMYNVTTKIFEPLEIGVNNNLDHSGLMSSSHGWELQLANKIDLGLFTGYNNVYYVQTGQGGSTVAQWSVGNATNYWTKFLDRTSVSQNIVKDKHKVIWLTLGINDAIAGTNADTFKAGLIELIDRMKAQINPEKIYVTELPPVNATYTSYTTKIQEIDAADPIVKAISFTGLHMRDTNHPSYGGMKQFTNRFIKAMRDDGYNILNKGYTWDATSNASLDGDGIYFSAATGNGYITTSFDADQPFSIVFDMAAQAEASVLILDSNTTYSAWVGAQDNYFSSEYWYQSVMYAINENFAGGNSADASVSTKSTFGAMVRSGDDIKVYYSNDGGANWTLLHTYTGALTGESVIRVKALSAASPAYIDAFDGSGFTFP